MFVTKYLAPDPSEGGGGTADPAPAAGGTTMDQLFTPQPTKPTDTPPATLPAVTTDPLAQPPAPETPPADPNKPVEEEEEVVEEIVEDAVAFYQDVDKIWGKTYEVDYGDVSPLSPEGVQLRERVLYEEGAKDYETNLQRTNPRGYAYLQHVALGRPDEDFFNDKSLSPLPVKETVTGNSAVQEQVYRMYMAGKGITDEDTVNDLITGLKASNKLEAKSLLAYNEMEQAQVKALDDYRKDIDEANKKIDTDIATFKTAVTNVVKAGYTDNLIIPESKKAEFEKFVQESTVYDPSTGKFMFVQNLDPSKLSLSQLYFAFNGGNINELVERKVATQTAVKKLGVVLGTKKPNPSTPAAAPQQRGNLPISSL